MVKQASLKENLLSLFLLQGSNYIIPLITLPYLVRVLGPEKFGLIAFAQGFVQYFIILTDYGFNLSATRLIALNKEKVSEIFCATMLVKMALMIVSLLVVVITVSMVPKFRNDWLVYFLAFLSVPGSVIFPVWFYQGMEQMRYISIVSISAKLLSAICIFIFVHEQGDYLRAVAIQSSGILVAGLLGIKMVWKVAPLRVKLPSRQYIIETLLEGWYVFISTAAIGLYTTSNIFILGLLTNNETVAFFSVADRIVSAAKGLIGPVSQAVYPRINALAKDSAKEAFQLIRKVLVWQGCSFFVISIFLFLLAEPLVTVLFSAKYIQSVVVLRWIAFLPFIIALSNVLGVQTMLTFGFNAQFAKIVIMSGIVNLTLLVPLSILMGAKGAAISVMTTELIVTIVMSIVLVNKGYNLFSNKLEIYEG